MTATARFTLFALSFLLGGCLPVFETTYVPTLYSDKDNWRVCGGADRPEFTFELSKEVDLKVSTIGSGSTSTVYLTVVTESEKHIQLEANLLIIQSVTGNTEEVELVRQSWESKVFRERYGPFYQVLTGSIDKLVGEKKLTFNFPNFIIDGQSLGMEPLVFTEHSSMGWHTCGDAW